MQEYKRDTKFVSLKEFDSFSKNGDFMELTQWYNGEGFDITVSAFGGDQRFSLTWGQWTALKVLVGAEDDSEDLT